MMELKEAFDIIDATLGMFRLFAAEISNSAPSKNFLATPVRSAISYIEIIWIISVLTTKDTIKR